MTRSKVAELTIRVDLSYESRNFNTLKSCLSHMKRIGELNISGAPGYSLENLFQSLPKSAPQLHIVSRPLLSSYRSGTTFTILEDFLCDSTQRLQCVNLVHCKIGWDSHLLTGLAHLTLHNSLKDNSTCSIIQFFACTTTNAWINQPQSRRFDSA